MQSGERKAGTRLDVHFPVSGGNGALLRELFDFAAMISMPWSAIQKRGDIAIQPCVLSVSVSGSKDRMGQIADKLCRAEDGNLADIIAYLRKVPPLQ
jgi:hypothetical protein